MHDLEPLLARLKDSGELTLEVKVSPKSSSNQIAGFMPDGALKLKIAAPPEKGKANSELCAFLAKCFAVPKANVTIKTGAASPRKCIRILA